MFFLTKATSFVAGWSWIVLARDVSTLLAYHGSEVPLRNYVGQVACAFAMGPMLTALLVRIEDLSHLGLSRRMGQLAAQLATEANRTAVELRRFAKPQPLQRWLPSVVPPRPRAQPAAGSDDDAPSYVPCTPPG